MVLAGVADIVVGHVISGRISATASKRLTGPVSVSVGATPALYDAVTGRIPAVTSHAPSTAVCNLRDVDVRATLTDVRRSNSRVTTQGVSADMVVTARTFAGLISSDFGTPTVTPDPSAGVLRIGIGPGGLLQIEEKAQLHGDTIQLSPAGMSLHGQPVPDSLKGTIASHLTISRTLSGLPLNLTPRSPGHHRHRTPGPFCGGSGHPDRHPLSARMRHSVTDSRRGNDHLKAAVKLGQPTNSLCPTRAMSAGSKEEPVAARQGETRTYEDWGGLAGRTVPESRSWWPKTPRPSAGAPNIIVVLLDDMGFSDIGPFQAAHAFE